MTTIQLGPGRTLQPFTQGKGTVIVGYLETHPRPDTGLACAGTILLEHEGAADGHPDHPRWKLVEGTPEAPVELSPSILCKSCGNHGWVRGGGWVPV